MIRGYLNLVVLFLILIGTASCSSSSRDLLPLELGARKVEILPEEITTIDILSGEGSYESIVEDKELVSATVIDKKLVIIGKGKKGLTNVIVRDRKNQVSSIHIVITAKEEVWRVTHFEDQVRSEDLEAIKIIKDSLSKKDYPITTGGGYKLTYLDKNRGDLVVYTENTPSELFYGTFTLDFPSLNMKYVEKGKSKELNYTISPDIIQSSSLGFNKIVLYEDWTSYFQGLHSLSKIDFAGKLQYLKSTLP